jgi:6-phosphogluconate dehydrogenase
MELGMIGLGRMGLNMARRLTQGGHRVVGYARTAATVNQAVAHGLDGAYTLEELVRSLATPRVVWLMIPAGAPVDATLEAVSPHLAPGDIVVDGGNSNYKDTVRRAADLARLQVHYVDVGTSGGVWGLAEGYSMMVGGPPTLAPAPDLGWGHVGPSGAGHFVKMVHNGIEYGLMQAYAEGFAILKGKTEFHLDLHQTAEIWRYGSVIRSWLLDLTAAALAEDAALSDVEPFVADSGEGRWTVFEAVDEDVAAPVITLALLQRLRSRDRESFSDRVLAVMRAQFGGHALKRKDSDAQ